MRVYRVERPTGEGPYTHNGGFIHRFEMQDAHMGSRHPSPYADFGLMGIADNEFCALDSPDALVAWFWGFLYKLQADGFVVNVYDVDEDDVRVGDYGQALFVRERATLVDTVSPRAMLARYRSEALALI